MRAKESRPSETTEAALNKKINATSEDESSIPDLADLEAMAEHVRGAFVVVVQVAEGRYRRRCYLSAAAAERAARRATDQGKAVSVFLAELRPVFRIGGAR